ncbi:unnamed protein product [Cyclocybe aegerita]|uniref:Uncharacterized protein n=1 Tax=Cyclocybe aegerita TaxID=1973307 RepID=A0A8S0W421_CYCAE|nr:unnamed protein product [Cyclocybe aegerita]
MKTQNTATIILWWPQQDRNFECQHTFLRGLCPALPAAPTSGIDNADESHERRSATGFAPGHVDPQIRVFIYNHVPPDYYGLYFPSAIPSLEMPLAMFLWSITNALSSNRPSSRWETLKYRAETLKSSIPPPYT